MESIAGALDIVHLLHKIKIGCKTELGFCAPAQEHNLFFQCINREALIFLLKKENTFCVTKVLARELGEKEKGKQP